MLVFLSENWGNILVLAVVAAVVAVAVRNVYKRKKAGGCGCGCSDCPSKGMCHPEK